MNKRTVLIVEDEAAQRNALTHTLVEAGFDVLHEKNGADGLATARTKHPDLIIVDIIMPKMNGLDMVKAIRADQWGKRVPIIILTNLSKMEELQQAMESGVYDYFIKTDTKLEDIVAKVTHILGSAS